jgi:CubicO group peptidase (beta-lactamase class C family)
MGKSNGKLLCDSVREGQNEIDGTRGCRFGLGEERVGDSMVIEGYVHPEFAKVAGIFRHQIERTSGGAAVAVYHRGELVVDLWGGTRNGHDAPWTRDTLAMCFSTTKGVASTALHLLADRGLVDYDAPVATYWPEFAQNGKEQLTVRHVLSHSAGLHRFATIVDRSSRSLDFQYMADALARSAPSYRPGTSVGYHGLPFGWLVGEIVRRVSGKPIDQFVREELAGPLGVDGLHIGCPLGARERLAPLQPMALPRLPGLLQPVLSVVGVPFSYLLSATGSPINPRRIANVFAGRSMEDVIYSPDILDCAMPAVNGFFDAVSLGAMYAMLAGGGALGDVRLLSEHSVRRLSEIQNDQRDRVIMVRMQWRLGYHRLVGTGGLPGAFGHFGLGGSGGWADPNHDAALAMVCNRGSGTPIGDLRIVKLNNAAADILRRRSTVRSVPRLSGGVLS